MDDKTKKQAKKIGSVRDLEVYQLAFETAMQLYVLSKTFPQEEKFSLTDQIRRSSRSVCANLSEAWRKRRYKAVFLNKLSDAAQEASETQTWLEFALKCDYMNSKDFASLDEQYEHIYAMLASMERKAETFCKSFESNRPSS